MSKRGEPVTTGDGSSTLRHTVYGETYHSTFGAQTEAQYVFIQGAGVARRLASGQSTRVLEIGFGLGLNFLLTADQARCTQTRLDYHAFEHDLPDSQTLESMEYAALLQHPHLQANLLEGLQKSAGQPLVHMQLETLIGLHIHRQDACCGSIPSAHYHAIYLDAFSPATNPECWSPVFIATLARALTNDGTLATYSAKGSVRRAMLAAGLCVSKRPGPPGKREILIADKMGQ